MNDISARFPGGKIYFDDLERAENFYLNERRIPITNSRLISSRAIFLDANVLQDAVFEKPVITKQTFRLGRPWGSYTHEVAITVPSYARRKGWIQYEIDSLPQLAELVRLGRFEPYINAELDFELAESDSGAFVTSELSVFHGISLLKVPAPFFYSRIVASSQDTGEELSKRRNHVFATDFDQRFNEIKQAANGNKNDGAFHILSAERAGIEYFITLDRKLINSLRHNKPFQSRVNVVFPSELLHEACDRPLNPDRDWPPLNPESRQRAKRPKSSDVFR